MCLSLDSLEKFLVTPSDLMLAHQSRGAINGCGLRAGPELKDEDIPAGYSSTLTHLLFNLCQDCEALNATMSCIPPSAFNAKHIRESQSKLKPATSSGANIPSSKYYNTMLQELNPLQYNSKMMNSVWGLYNRYSSHNVKTNNDVCIQHSQEVQQSAASSKNESVINLPNKMKLDNVWAALNFSQSH